MVEERGAVSCIIITFTPDFCFFLGTWKFGHTSKFKQSETSEGGPSFTYYVFYTCVNYGLEALVMLAVTHAFIMLHPDPKVVFDTDKTN